MKKILVTGRASLNGATLMRLIESWDSCWIVGFNYGIEDKK